MMITAERLPEPIAPPIADAAPSGAALRAELAALIQADLLGRISPADDAERDVIVAVSEVAAGLAHLTKMLVPGCDPFVAPLLLGGITRTVRGLCLLGTDRIAGSAAEEILTSALAVEGAALASIAPAGTA